MQLGKHKARRHGSPAGPSTPPSSTTPPSTSSTGKLLLPRERSTQTSPELQPPPLHGREQKPTDKPPTQPLSPLLQMQLRPLLASQSLSSMQGEPVAPDVTTRVPVDVVCPAAPPAASMSW